MDKNSKKLTGTLEHRKLLSRYRFVQAVSNYRKEKSAENAIASSAQRQKENIKLEQQQNITLTNPFSISLTTKS